MFEIACFLPLTLWAGVGCVMINFIPLVYITITPEGALWLSGRVLDSRPRGLGFEPHRRRCIVVLEQDTFILSAGSTHEDLSLFN